RWRGLPARARPVATGSWGFLGEPGKDVIRRMKAQCRRLGNKGLIRCVVLPEIADGDDMKTKKSFREKLADDHGLPRVEPIIPTIAERWRVTGTMVIPAPREVDEIMRRGRSGRLLPIKQNREAPAQRHGTNAARPITNRPFASIPAPPPAQDRARGPPASTAP